MSVCGAVRPGGNATCQLPAGWGTDHVGSGLCRHHDTDEASPDTSQDEDARHCPDCGSEVRWQPNEKTYICDPCGLRHDRITIEDHHHGRV